MKPSQSALHLIVHNAVMRYLISSQRSSCVLKVFGEIKSELV